MALDPNPPPDPYAPPGEFPYGTAPLAQRPPAGGRLWIAVGIACLAVMALVVATLVATAGMPQPPRRVMPSATPPSKAVVVPDDGHGEGFTLTLPDGWDARMPGTGSLATTRITLRSGLSSAIVGSVPKAERVPLARALDATLHELGQSEPGLRWIGQPHAREVGGEPALSRRVGRARDDGTAYWLVVFYRHGTRFYAGFLTPDDGGGTSEPPELGRLLAGWQW